MAGFIDDKVICAIINTHHNEPYSLIETKFNISPFGMIGKKTYYATVKDLSDKELTLEISGELYDKY